MAVDEEREGDNGDAQGLAAEYVLGTLDRDERRAAERRILRDPLFAGAVDDWAQRFAALDDAAGEVTPPPHVWERIAARIGVTNIIPFERGRFETSLRRWRITAAAAGLAAALLAVVVAREALAPPAAGPASYVAVLGGEGGAPAFVASVDTAAGTIRLRRVGAAPPPDRSFELWQVPASGPTVSLGLADGERELKALDVALKPGERLAISVEPKGGSPTGQATGPVVYIGELLPAE